MKQSNDKANTKTTIIISKSGNTRCYYLKKWKYSCCNIIYDMKEKKRNSMIIIIIKKNYVINYFSAPFSNSDRIEKFNLQVFVCLLDIEFACLESFDQITENKKPKS